MFNIKKLFSSGTSNRDPYGSKCINCESMVHIKKQDGTISVHRHHGIISINLPGIICASCIDDVLENVPDPPGIICLNTLSCTNALDYVANGDFISDSMSSVKFLIELFPESIDMYDNSAVRLYREGYQSEALGLLEYGIRTLKNCGQLLLEKAAMLDMNGESQRAMVYFDKISDQSLHSYYLVKGNILKNMNKWQEAAEAWEYDISSGRQNYLAFNNLGYYLLHVCKDYARAQSHYRQAIEVFPTEYRFIAYLGDSLCFDNKINAGLPYLQNALDMVGANDDEFRQSVIRSMNLHSSE